MEEHILIYQGRNVMEAHMVAGLLEDRGLEPLLEQEDVSSVFGGMSPVDAGVRILIPASQREAALRILREAESEVGLEGAPQKPPAQSPEDTISDPEPESRKREKRSIMRTVFRIGKYPITLLMVLNFVAGVCLAAWAICDYLYGGFLFGAR